MKIIKDFHLHVEHSQNGIYAKARLDFHQLEKYFPPDTIVYLNEYHLLDFYEKKGLSYTEIINSNELKLGETIQDFLDAANGDIEHAAILYDMVDWQSPYSLGYELDFED